MMRAALALARRSLGRTWPNPAVGCVIVRDGQVIARGRTQDGGRPHAEADAIAQATAQGLSLKGATAYVTLEPCSHHGRTPPCADALVGAGVARVVSALEDPDPRVKGRGHERLRAAGIEVVVGDGAAEAAEINAGFLTRVKEGRPLFHLKVASSLDGRIATASGESKWITGPAARLHGHHLRATHDAILVGVETALADDPDLGCRLPGLAARSPVRLVLDSKARLSPQSKLATTAGQRPVWLLCTKARAACGARCAGQARRRDRRGGGWRGWSHRRGRRRPAIGRARIDPCPDRRRRTGGGLVPEGRPRRPYLQLPGGASVGRRQPLCGRATGAGAAGFRAPVPAGFGPATGRRHAGNLAAGGLSSGHVYRHRHRHR